MKIPLSKVHGLATLLAVITIFLSAIVLFVVTIDEILRWHILPNTLEEYVYLIGWFVGILAMASTLISIVLSLYGHRTDA